MITTSWEKLTQLVSNSKKVQVRHRRFGYTSNARIICSSKLLTGIENFSADYNLTEIYSNFEKSKSEDLTIDNIDLPSKQQITLKASKITDSGSDSDKICKPYIRNKQTCIVCRQKPRTSTNKKLEEVHVDLWGPYDLAS